MVFHLLRLVKEVIVLIVQLSKALQNEISTEMGIYHVWSFGVDTSLCSFSQKHYRDPRENFMLEVSGFIRDRCVVDV